MTWIRKSLLAAAVAALLISTGCTAGQTGEREVQMTVYTSFYPMYDFTQKIAGEHARVVNMVPAGTAAHDWEPTARDIVGLGSADVFIYSGAGMEHWVDRVLSSLNNQEIVVVEASRGLELLAGGHSHEHGEAHVDEEDGYEEGAEHNHDHGNTDPHVWLSPRNAARQMQAICEALEQADPENASAYRANLERWEAEMTRLDEEFRQKLEPLENRTIIVSHQAFGYLCEEYGLKQIAAMDYVPEGEPTPARLAELVDFAKEHPVKVVFYEASGSSKVADVLAKEIGAQTGVLYPLEFLDGQQIADGMDYLSVMRLNLEALEHALA